MRFFSWCGVGLSDECAHTLFLAMTKLKADKSLGLRSVRFFGKILTCGRPYWVVEGVLDQPEPQPAFSELGPSHPEPPGTGLNACVYFVSNDVCEPFTKLADVRGPPHSPLSSPSLASPSVVFIHPYYPSLNLWLQPSPHVPTLRHLVSPPLFYSSYL